LAAQELLGESKWRRAAYFFHFFVNMSFWASVMCQEETSESMEGVFPGGVINHGKNLLKRFDSLNKLRGSSKFSGAWQVMVKFLRWNLPCGTHYGIGIICLTETGEQQIDWGPEKD